MGFLSFFSEKVRIVSRTLSGLFLVGAVDRPKKEEKDKSGNPQTIPGQFGKISEKSGKSQKGDKKNKVGSTQRAPFQRAPVEK